MALRSVLRSWFSRVLVLGLTLSLSHFCLLMPHSDVVWAQNDDGGGNGGGNDNGDGNNNGDLNFNNFDSIPGAGVVISAGGVLRTTLSRDINGQLSRQRRQQARAALDPDVARPSKLRKISLNRLEQAIQENLDHGAPVSDDMRFLAGLTRLQYVFFYPESNDIVIAGPAEGYMQDEAGRPIGILSGRVVIELQDLVVALRAYGPGGQAEKVVGVSIDPTQEGLSRMQQFVQSVGSRAVPGDTQAIASGLRQSLGLQEITINGVSPRTHFAHVMVEADYRMKLIGIGLETPPVKITSYVERANPASVRRNAMQRWYFVPDYETVRMTDDGLAMELVGNTVKLVGADEVVRSDGTRTKASKGDRAGSVYVRSFTRHYQELAQRAPVYGQLRNFIDLLITAAFIQEQDYYGQASWHMVLFGDEQRFPLETLPEPKTVESAVNAIWKGRYLVTPIGGGVHIQPQMALSPEHLLDDNKGEVKKAHRQTAQLELADGQWWWD